jgi:hypothetical protein
MSALISPNGNAQNNEKAIVVRNSSAAIIVTKINTTIEKMIAINMGYFLKFIKK